MWRESTVRPSTCKRYPRKNRTIGIFAIAFESRLSVAQTNEHFVVVQRDRPFSTVRVFSTSWNADRKTRITRWPFNGDFFRLGCLLWSLQSSLPVTIRCRSFGEVQRQPLFNRVRVETRGTIFFRPNTDQPCVSKSSFKMHCTESVMYLSTSCERRPTR